MKIRDTEIKIIQGDIANIKADFIVQSKGRGLDSNVDEAQIRSAYAGALCEAEKLKVSSIVFSAPANFPETGSAKIIAQEVFRHLWFGCRETFLREIIFVLSDKSVCDIFRKNVLSYLEYIIHKLHEGPFVTVDIIIELSQGIVLIERSNPPYGWALPGGFMDYNESLEDCATREAKEETSLDVYDLAQFHTYSNPGRDPRFHTVTTVFTARAHGIPRADSDAANLKVFKKEEALRLDLAFDHAQIIRDYYQSK